MYIRIVVPVSFSWDGWEWICFIPVSLESLPWLLCMLLYTVKVSNNGVNTDLSASFLCVSGQRATLGLNRFHEASSILVARHLSASRFQWQLLGGLMNRTGHSVCPHVTPDWIAVHCWLNAKFSLLPPRCNTHPAQIFSRCPSCEKSTNKGYTKEGCNWGTFQNKTKQKADKKKKKTTLDSQNWPFSSQGLTCVLYTICLSVRVM